VKVLGNVRFGSYSIASHPVQLEKHDGNPMEVYCSSTTQLILMLSVVG
jgi:spore coat protein U-like protein